MRELYGRIWTDGYSPTIDVEYEAGTVTITVTDVDGTRSYEINLSESSISDRSIGHEKLKLETITADELADGAVTADKIGSGAVTEGKIGTGAVTEGKIGSGAVTEGKIGNGAVTSDKLAGSAVTTAKINDSAVTTGKINDSAVTTGKIADSAVTNDKLASGAAVANIGYTPQEQHSSLSITIAVSDWNNNTCTKTVSGVTANNTVIISPAVSSIEDYGEAQVRGIAQAANQITFACEDTPSDDLTVNIAVLG